jgi:pSer/pThr/pTyr-binding forkhead associated (FHA) protein
MVYRLVGRLVDRDIEFELKGGAVVLGSDSACDLVVDDRTVSRRHAEITPLSSGVQVVDLGSKNGTYVGSVAVERRVVGHGESLRFGRLELLVEDSDPQLEPTEKHPAPVPEQEPAEPPTEKQVPRPGQNPIECFVSGPMQDAIRELATSPDLTQLAAIVGHGLAMCLPVSTVEIGWKTPGAGSTLYCHRQEGIEFSSEQITRLRDELYLYCAFKTTPRIQALESLLDIALSLVSLAQKLSATEMDASKD